MCSCYTKIKKAVKFVCFWVIILTAIDAGLTAIHCSFLTAILTHSAQIVVSILAGISAIIVLVGVTFGLSCHGGRCKCGCECGCDCGCTCNDCKCGDDCKCNEKETKKVECCATKPDDKNNQAKDKKN